MPKVNSIEVAITQKFNLCNYESVEISAKLQGELYDGEERQEALKKLSEDCHKEINRKAEEILVNRGQSRAIVRKMLYGKFVEDDWPANTDTSTNTQLTEELDF